MPLNNTTCRFEHLPQISSWHLLLSLCFTLSWIANFLSVAFPFSSIEEVRSASANYLFKF
jgi:hypothetical protein